MTGKPPPSTSTQNLTESVASVPAPELAATLESRALITMLLMPRVLTVPRSSTSLTLLICQELGLERMRWLAGKSAAPVAELMLPPPESMLQLSFTPPSKYCCPGV